MDKLDDALPAMLSRTVNPFTPIQVGKLVIGWISLRGDHPDAGGWFVTVGDNLLPLPLPRIILRCHELDLEIPSMVRFFWRYNADIVFHMPLGSVDFTAGGMVDCTERTVENFLTLFSKFLPALQSDVQSRFNNDEAPEARKTYAELLESGYPYVCDLRWRGRAVIELNALVPQYAEEGSA